MTSGAVFRYLLLLVPSLLLAAWVWSLGIVGRLYYCADSVLLLDFVPPFVHSDVPSSPLDHYIAAPWVVYAVWSLFLAVALCLPLLAIRRFRSGEAFQA